MNKNTLITLRISEADKMLLKAAAEFEGLTLSSNLVRIGKAHARSLGIINPNIEQPKQTKLKLKGRR